MKKKTNTATTNTISTVGEQVLPLPVMNQTEQDAKNALLIVSLIANAFVFICWIVLQVTTVYDAQVAAFLFTR